MKIAVLRKGCAKLKSFWAAAQWRTLAGIQIGILLKRKVLERLKAEFESIEVINIEFDVEELEVTVLIDGYKLDVSFDSPAGFRVLDEGDLLEFWPDCSSPNGWLYEIFEGGWFDQERNRKGFVSTANNPAVREYFIVGTNYCVNVLALAAPCVVESIR